MLRFAPLPFLCLPLLVLATTPPESCEPTPYWADEFDGVSLDRSRWSYRGLGPDDADAKRRDAYNTVRAVEVADGHMTIRNYTEKGVHYTSMISTRGKFEPLFGYIEARIRVYDPPGVWSAFWYQSPDIGFDRGFMGRPRVAGTEMDIMEHLHRNNEQVFATIHWNYNAFGGADDKASSGPVGKKLNEGFHVYGWEWMPGYCKFYINGELITTFAEKPSSGELESAISWRPQYVILSKEVQHKGWGGGIGEIPANGFGAKGDERNPVLVVDWVRYYLPKTIIKEDYGDSPSAETLQASGWRRNKADAKEVTLKRRFQAPQDCLVVDMSTQWSAAAKSPESVTTLLLEGAGRPAVKLDIQGLDLHYFHALGSPSVKLATLKDDEDQRIMLVLDLAAKKYDIYVNEERIGVYLPFYDARAKDIEALSIIRPDGDAPLPLKSIIIR